VHFLANLCHSCGACLHACQYAPPHEFAVNIPAALAQVRGQTYTAYAWPAALGGLYRRNGLTLALASFGALAAFLAASLALNGRLWGAVPAGDFYALFPHGLLVSLFLPVFLWAALALGIGVTRFLRDITPATGGQRSTAAATAEAAHLALRLKYLDGGHGDGCNNEDDAFSQARRHAHHLVFYGFALCFAATALGTVYHYAFGWKAPYDWPSLPKLLGGVGGVALMLGITALWWLKSRRHPLHGAASQAAMDYGFMALLFATAATGLAAWATRSTAALPLMLALHLGAVMALFLTLPYGKFAHGIYRSAALLRHTVERKQPDPHGLGGD
jgi:citrate/tricarballylate utilization protein